MNAIDRITDALQNPFPYYYDQQKKQFSFNLRYQFRGSYQTEKHFISILISLTTIILLCTLNIHMEHHFSAYQTLLEYTYT